MNEYKIPIQMIKQISCKVCQQPVKPFILDGFYTCDQCNSVTNQVNVIAVETIGLMRVYPV